MNSVFLAENPAVLRPDEQNVPAAVARSFDCDHKPFVPFKEGTDKRFADTSLKQRLKVFSDLIPLRDGVGGCFYQRLSAHFYSILAAGIDDFVNHFAVFCFDTELHNF